MSQALKIDLTIDSPDLRVWSHRGDSARLVVCFSGVGPDADEPPGYEFAATAARQGRDSVLYVADPRRSWLNGKGLIEAVVEQVERFAAEIGAEQICALGHSMGGFSACVLPDFTKIDVAIAMSPQASVHPDFAGDDPRWMEYREKIERFRVRHVEDHIRPETQYFTIFGMHPREIPQRKRFPVAENIELLRMPKTHHNTAQRLRAKGLLDAVVQAAFDRRIYRVRRLIRRNFGVPYRDTNQIRAGSLTAA